jgi:hypothetical protein
VMFRRSRAGLMSGRTAGGDWLMVGEDKVPPSEDVLSRGPGAACIRWWHWP